MNEIHPTAVVSSKAELGDNNKIGPFAVIEDDVEIGNDNVIGPHAVIYNGARLGNRIKIFQSAAVSNAPQDLKYADEETYFHIGDDTKIRECVTLHKGTVETGYSKVGKNCLLMAYAHVAHDCIIGDNVILANSVQVGGHVEIGNNAIIGGATPVHQFSKIGEHCMIGGGFRVIADVPPYILAGGEPLKYSGLNLLGLRRRGFSNEDIGILKEAYAILFTSGMNLSEGKKELIEKHGENQYVQKVLDFLEKSNRGIIKR